MTKFTFAQREEGFDNHIEHSIRGYTNLWNDVLKYSEYFVEDDTDVVDVGCSTGKLLKAMIAQNTFAPNAHYVGIEIEEDFYSTYDEDVHAYDYLYYHRGDVRDFAFNNCSLVTSIFTLQFIPEVQRLDIIRQIYDGLNPGGAFIFAEKTISEYSKIQEIKTFTYYDYKREHFTAEDILDKEKQLRHMMKLNTRNELISKCATAGFSFQKIDSFWQNYGFTAFIAIK
jgi:tRNA (cmo5U34)-methyltransferase